VSLKIRCRDAGIALLEVAPPKVRADLTSATSPVQDRVLKLLRDPPLPLRMDPKGVLEISLKGRSAGPLELAREGLDLLLGMSGEGEGKV